MGFRKIYSLEIEFVNDLENFLKDAGFKTFREVVPNQHQDGREYPFKVDLIFWKEGLGYFAVEVKNCSIRSGGEIGKAIEQILKYRDMTYFDGVKIPNWYFSFPQLTYHQDENKDFEIALFLNHLCNYLWNIGFLRTYDYNYSNP